MAEGYISIVNWEKFQQYKDRRPTWIKAYVALLDHYEFSQLPDECKAHFHGLWLLAALTDNKIPNDPVWIARRINATATIDLLRLKSLGFIQYESLEPSVRMAQTKRSLETETETYTEEKETYSPPAAVATNTAALVVGGSWSSEAVDDWIAAYRGTAPGGRIGKALKPLVSANGWPAVRKAWRSYLAQTDPQFASPQHFAGSYGRWSGDVPSVAPSGGRNVVDHNRAVLAQFASEESDANQKRNG